jgi:hypothetical protein
MIGGNAKICADLCEPVLIDQHHVEAARRQPLLGRAWALRMLERDVLVDPCDEVSDARSA